MDSMIALMKVTKTKTHAVPTGVLSMAMGSDVETDMDGGIRTDAYLPIPNVMGKMIAQTGGTSLKRCVGPIARRWVGGLAATMGSASMPGIDAMGTMTALMEATKLPRHVP